MRRWGGKEDGKRGGRKLEGDGESEGGREEEEGYQISRKRRVGVGGEENE